jgi:hypothetical protein
VTKIESKALKSFGRIIAVFLCIFAAINIIASFYIGITGKTYGYKGVEKSTFRPHRDYQKAMR